MNRSIALAILLQAAAAVSQEIPSTNGAVPPAPGAGGPVPTAPADGASAAESQPAKVDPSKPLGSREAADALTEEELAQVVDLLRNNYIQPNSLTELAVAR